MVPDFKGFIVPVEAGPEGAVASAAGGGAASAVDDNPSAAFLTRGYSLKKRVSLEGVTVPLEDPVSCRFEVGVLSLLRCWFVFVGRRRFAALILRVG